MTDLFGPFTESCMSGLDIPNSCSCNFPSSGPPRDVRCLSTGRHIACVETLGTVLPSKMMHCHPSRNPEAVKVTTAGLLSRVADAVMGSRERTRLFSTRNGSRQRKGGCLDSFQSTDLAAKVSWSFTALQRERVISVVWFTAGQAHTHAAGAKTTRTRQEAVH